MEEARLDTPRLQFSLLVYRVLNPSPFRLFYCIVALSLFQIPHPQTLRLGILGPGQLTPANNDTPSRLQRENMKLLLQKSKTPRAKHLECCRSLGPFIVVKLLFPNIAISRGSCMFSPLADPRQQLPTSGGDIRILIYTTMLSRWTVESSSPGKHHVGIVNLKQTLI